MQTANHRQLRVIWAVDPFAKEAEIQKNAALAIKALLGDQPATVEPIYIAADPRHEVPPKLRLQYARQIAFDAQDEVDEWIGRLRVPGLLPVRVLGPSSASTRERVNTLLDYAHEAGADFLVASTRARKGPSRWFFGSFVETLSLLSDLPLFVVNPLWDPTVRARPKFEWILFPTDFSDESHDALMALLPFAQGMRCRIALFHKLTLGLVPAMEVPPSLLPISGEVRQEAIDTARRKMDLWVREIKRKGVDAEGEVDLRGESSVTASILQQSRKYPGLITLAGESNSMEAALLGSVTRQILREATCPVWVFRPSFRAKSDLLPQSA